jgi:hypothetical protein
MFPDCTNLTDMSVFELSALPKLRRIGLVRVTNLTDEAVYSLAERHATLERIHLSYCDQISVMAVHFLLLKLHKLTHLSLSGVPAFRTPELQRFCKDAPKVSQHHMYQKCDAELNCILGFQYCPKTKLLRLLWQGCCPASAVLD